MNIQSVEKVKGGLSQELLQEIIDVIVRQVHPSRILLYGSRARSSYTLTSDVDIAIDCGEDDFLIQSIDEEIRTLLRIDIVNFRKVNKKLQHEILLDRINLYEKT